MSSEKEAQHQAVVEAFKKAKPHNKDVVLTSPKRKK
jgi:hypothetical protein